jgi:hypothetical protein
VEGARGGRLGSVTFSLGRTYAHERLMTSFLVGLSLSLESSIREQRAGRGWVGWLKIFDGGGYHLASGAALRGT